MSGSNAKPRRSYQPAVEGLESLRLLSGGLSLTTPVPLAPEFAPSTTPTLGTDPLLDSAHLTTSRSDSTWDEALGLTRLSEILGESSGEAVLTTDPALVGAGLSQLSRYLNRAWYRAGIAPQKHEDCTQAVFVSLLQGLGRDRFDALMNDVGQSGIREVLHKETPEGLDFFRAVDTVKKRAQREKSFQPLEDGDVLATPTADTLPADWRSTLDEIIPQTLSPREAALIQATLHGETPAEIASRWGVAPKTVSNEKTRALQKLRIALGEGSHAELIA